MSYRGDECFLHQKPDDDILFRLNKLVHQPIVQYYMILICF